MLLVHLYVSQIKAWTLLQHLDMRNNGLAALPEEAVADWPGLQSLLLSNNKLPALPSAVSRMHSTRQYRPALSHDGNYCNLPGRELAAPHGVRRQRQLAHQHTGSFELLHGAAAAECGE